MAARFVALACLLGLEGALGEAASESAAANPIRKVVNLLQAMMKKVEKEGEKSEDLHEKFMCYCKTSGGGLETSIAAAEDKIPALEAAIKSAASRKEQAEADLKQHQTDRSAAKVAMTEATAIREKEKAAFDKALAESKTNLAAMGRAITAIDKGMGAGFLQTPTAAAVRAIFEDRQDVTSGDRQEILAFLSQSQSGEYAPASGEISGILKTMHDEMSTDQKNEISSEEAAVKSNEGLMETKEKLVATLTKSIETKMQRIGDLGIEIATMKGDLGDTSDALAEDKAFAQDLKKDCATRGEVHAEEKQMRAQEVVALADTIKILNDDDALELFKKTLPGAGSSFLQVQKSADARQVQARALLEQARSHMKPGQHRHLDFVLLALHGRKVGFGKIVKMIDELVATLKTEQQDDEHKKEYCVEQFDQADDKKKGLERSISDLETVIAESKESIATLGEEIAGLKTGIVALDKAVAEATEQRQAEAAEYKDLMASNGAAKELILFAKNRLNKFYNPKLFKAAPKRELSAGDRIYENQGGEIPTEAAGGIAGTGISFAQLSSRSGAAPPPPPASAAAYVKSSEANGGVMAMMGLLVQDLDKEMTVAETDETNAQAEYKQIMSESAEKRAQDSKSLTDKEAAKADTQSALERSIADKKAAGKELMGTMKYIMALKSECDWLLQYFDVRKEARADEIDSLQKAKAVLSGADFSFLQHTDALRARKFLRGL